jgi:CMP-N,N'-diacetyllegionaminic acid synthase
MRGARLAGACWGLIPARGGSKTIPLKNVAPFGGRPLIDYGVAAAKAARSVSRIVCSTDSTEIAARCRALGVEVSQRLASLSADDTPVQAVIAHFAEQAVAREGAIAEFVALLQPTSPFLLPEHIDACVAALVARPDAGSSQTVVECPHNHHAVNQRVIEDGYVAFRFPEERRAAYNKQRKKTHYLFGNLVVFRVDACLGQQSPFAQPSLPVIVDKVYGFDADGPADFRLGSLMIEKGLVSLPHMAAPTAGSESARVDA